MRDSNGDAQSHDDVGLLININIEKTIQHGTARLIIQVNMRKSNEIAISILFTQCHGLVTL